MLHVLATVLSTLSTSRESTTVESTVQVLGTEYMLLL